MKVVINSMMSYEQQSQGMIERQIIARGVTDPSVIKAFKEVPRHEFVPIELRGEAYEDHPVPIGFNQTISQPFMVALMTELLALKPDEKALEIGGGSGYQAAILSKLARDVISVERIPELCVYAADNLRRIGITNVTVICGDGSIGVKEKGPYDAIIMTCAAPGVPEELLSQLEEGGRLVIPVGPRFSQILQLIVNNKGKYDVTDVTGCVFVPLIGEKGWGK